MTWNCGAEGPTTDLGVQRLRGRQQRNLAAALLLSQGVPMILMGDEYGHSKVKIDCVVLIGMTYCPALFCSILPLASKFKPPHLPHSP